MRYERRVLHILFTNPGFYPPLLRGARLQAEAGWDVCMVAAHVRSSPESELPEWLNERVRIFGGITLPTIVRYLCFSVLAVFNVFRNRPGVVYLSDPKSTPVGAICILWPGVRVVYHEHDAPPSDASRTTDRLLMTCRRFVAGQADVCVVPSKGRLDLLPVGSRDNQRRLVVRNVPLLSETRSQVSQEEKQLCVLFLGSIVPSRIPQAIIRALAELPEVYLQIVGYETIGHKGYVDVLIRCAKELDLGDRVRFEGFVPRFDDLPDLIRGADVGLSLMPTNTADHNERTMAGASNKPFQYLACGVPLLVSDRPEWRQMFVDRRVACSCRPNTSESVADALRWFSENRAKAQEMGRRGRTLVKSQWNYETEFAPVIDLLERKYLEEGR